MCCHERPSTAASLREALTDKQVIRGQNGVARDAGASREGARRWKRLAGEEFAAEYRFSERVVDLPMLRDRHRPIDPYVGKCERRILAWGHWFRPPSPWWTW